MQETQEMWVLSLGQKDPLEEEMATQSRVLAWEIPRTKETGRPQSMESQKVWQDWALLLYCKSHLFIFAFISITLLLLSCFSHVRLCATLWTVAHQAPWSMRFSRQEYWSGLSVSSSRCFSQPNPGIKSESPALAGGFFTTSTTWEVVSTARKISKI